MSSRPMREIERRLAAGDTVLLDGATGTELEHRGVPMHGEVWCAMATLSHPHVLRAMHEDYVRAGASVITANTFASNRIMLDPAGLGDRFAELNRRAVEIALEARERAADDAVVAVAGSMSHMTPMRPHSARFDPARAPDPATARAHFEEMAHALADAGVDLILMEMMDDPDLAVPAVEAAVATGLPVWVGYSARRGAGGQPVSYRLPDLDFADLVRRVQPSAAPVAGVMHTQPDVTGPALARLRTVFDGPMMAYPDSGRFEMPRWHFEEVIAPPAFAAAALGWRDAGARILGGCCGLGVAHIEALAEVLARE